MMEALLATAAFCICCASYVRHNPAVGKAAALAELGLAAICLWIYAVARWGNSW